MFTNYEQDNTQTGHIQAGKCQTQGKKLFIYILMLLTPISGMYIQFLFDSCELKIALAVFFEHNSYYAAI